MLSLCRDLENTLSQFFYCVAKEIFNGIWHQRSGWPCPFLTQRARRKCIDGQILFVLSFSLLKTGKMGPNFVCRKWHRGLPSFSFCCRSTVITVSAPRIVSRFVKQMRDLLSFSNEKCVYFYTRKRPEIWVHFNAENRPKFALQFGGSILQRKLCIFPETLRPILANKNLKISKAEEQRLSL